MARSSGRAPVKISKPNMLLFWDSSTLKLHDLWANALGDKLRHEGKTVKDFLNDFAAWLTERWGTKTCSDKFHVIKWSEADDFSTFRSEFNSVADLAENELYYYLRPWIMGLILAEHGGKAVILTEKGSVEYPGETDRKGSKARKPNQNPV